MNEKEKRLVELIINIVKSSANVLNCREEILNNMDKFNDHLKDEIKVNKERILEDLNDVFRLYYDQEEFIRNDSESK